MGLNRDHFPRQLIRMRDSNTHKTGRWAKPRPLYRRRKNGELLLGEFTHPAFGLPMPWLIFEPTKNWNLFDMPFIGVMTRPRAAKFAVAGFRSLLKPEKLGWGIVAYPFEPIYDEEGNLICWRLESRPLQRIRHPSMGLIRRENIRNMNPSKLESSW